MIARHRWFPFAAAAAVLAAAVFSTARTIGFPLRSEAGRKLKIVATVFPLAEFAREICGERGEVLLLLPAGADVHHWLPRISDVRKLQAADLLISIGKGLEPWLSSLVKGSAARTIPAMEAAEGLDLIPAGGKAEEAEHSHGSVDPHVWLDFGQDMKIVEALTRALSGTAPESAALFSRNAEGVNARLRRLDESYRASLDPFRGRSFFIAGHAAFAYLARRYGLVQISLTGLSPDAETTPRQTAAAISRAKAEGIKTVYFEPSTGDKMARLIAAEIGADVRPLYPGHNLESGQEGGAMTFFQFMERNLENLVHGFTGR
ncbi:MAG: zinc ABC transporter substrate-binding protein [Candidatus Aminicenantes bacterium]|nr:zinc ABC transporter substrate-binding protein [Candidatus Aminicenantes bacterium]